VIHVLEEVSASNLALLAGRAQPTPSVFLSATTQHTLTSTHADLQTNIKGVIL
jgi:hypothetical protein